MSKAPVASPADPASEPEKEPLNGTDVPTAPASPSAPHRSGGIRIDLLTVLMTAVFAVNLLLFFRCQHENLSSIAERDRRTAPPRETAPIGADSGTSERHRIKIGEAEQVIHDPNHQPEAPAHDDDAQTAQGQGSVAGTAAAGSNKSAADPGPAQKNKNGIDCHLLSIALRSEPGREALLKLAGRKDHLKLTAEQTEVFLSTNQKKGQAELNVLIHDALFTLRPAQLEYMAANRKKIDELSIRPLSTSVIISNTCEKLESIKGGHPRFTSKEPKPMGLWDPRHLAIGIDLFTDISDEELLIDASQAQQLDKYLQKIGELDNMLQTAEDKKLRIETILSEEQMQFLYKELKNKVPL